MPTQPSETRQMSLDELVSQEMRSLREELRDLKGYQFRLVGVASVVTGFLLSLGRLRLDPSQSAQPPESLYLLPLIVILPSWMIYFDKTKTITRIVGYYRILEAMLAQEARPRHFFGWERALGKFRKSSPNVVKRLNKARRRRTPANRRVQRFVLTMTLIQSQLYWTLAYATFIILAIICLWIPVRSLYPISMYDLSSGFHLRWTAESFLSVSATLSTFYCAAFCGIILARLTAGENSYDSMELVWKRVLRIRIVERPRRHS